MKTNVRDTSLEAHDSIQADGTAVSKRNRVMAWIRANPRCSRQDVARGTGIAINCVCGRVHELIAAHALIEREMDKIDAVSSKRVNTLEAVPAQASLALEAA